MAFTSAASIVQVVAMLQIEPLYLYVLDKSSIMLANESALEVTSSYHFSALKFAIALFDRDKYSFESIGWNQLYGFEDMMIRLDRSRCGFKEVGVEGVVDWVPTKGGFWVSNLKNENEKLPTGYVRSGCWASVLATSIHCSELS